MMKMTKPVYTLLALVLMANGLFGQDDFKPMNPERRERMESLRIWKMTEFLELSSDQSVLFFPKLREYEKSIRSDQEGQREIIRRINEKIEREADRIGQDDVRKYTQQMTDFEKRIIDKKQKFILDLSDVLTPEQQMKFIIFDSNFRNRLMKMLNPEDRPMGPQSRRRN